MTRITSVLIVVAAALLVAVTASDTCSQFTSCQTCAGINGCGWCSEPVVYSDGTTGANCASPSTSEPFQCNGLYSTDQCLQGYICDQASGACRLAGPGQGTDFNTCNAACMVGPVAEVYGCMPGTTSCVVVPPGTPGAGSQQACEQQCVQPPAKVYACNSTDQCAEVPAGTPGSSSYEVCMARGCNSGSYGCDLSSMQCVAGAGNQSQAYCEKNCRPANDPCEQYTTCESCLAGSSVCGWCSQDVVYANGQKGGQCGGVNASILPFNCLGTYSTTQCAGTPSPSAPTAVPTPSPYLPPGLPCPKGSMVLLQYNCADSNCNGCNSGTAAMCSEPHCTYYCSGMCQPVPYWGTSFMWSCNGNPNSGVWTNATLVHYLQSTKCEGPTNPPGVGGSGTFPLNECGSPDGPNIPPQYNTFMCVPCGSSCDGN